MGALLSSREVEALEDVAARAVPAAETVEHGGWLLRATPGLATKRANSALARDAAAPPAQLGERIEVVEAFYGTHGLPARFQLSPAPSPEGLTRELRSRGYRASPPVDVQIAPLATAIGLAGPNGLGVAVADRAGEAWWRTWTAAAGVRRERAPAVADLFDRIAGETAFACAHDPDGEVVAVGMGVREGDWVGVFNMATLPAHRGRGAGRAALRALAEWGRRSGASRGYVQVEADNGPAMSLYRRAGFRAAYRYAYLTAGAAAQ